MSEGQVYKLIASAGPLSGGTKVIITDEYEIGTVAVRTLVKNVNRVWLFAETTRDNLMEV